MKRNLLACSVLLAGAVAVGHGEGGKDSLQDPTSPIAPKSDQRSTTTIIHSGPTGLPDDGPGLVALEPCLVSLIDDVDVPAAEAGVVDEIKVVEGDEVQPRQHLVQIDPTKAKLQEQVAVRHHQHAK